MRTGNFALAQENLFPKFFPKSRKDDYLDNTMDVEQRRLDEAMFEISDSYIKKRASLTEYRIQPIELNLDTKIELKNVCIGSVSFKLKHISQSIDESRYLMSLEEDWDDEGGLPITEDTWKRSVKLLINYANWIFKNLDTVLAAPTISAGPDESIDMVWRTNDFRLIINIAEDSSKPATFYGDDRKGGASLKGNIPLEGIQEYFALWLRNLKK